MLGRLVSGILGAVTQSNVELLDRGATPSTTAGDTRPDAELLGLLDPEIAWYSPPDSMDRGVWHGRDGVREWFEEFAFVVFSELRFEPERYLELGEGEARAIPPARRLPGCWRW